MPYFFRSLGGRTRGLILVASAAAVGGGGLFACRDSSIGGASGPLWNRRQQSTVPLFDASAVERVEEHARYPCKAFPGYSVVVTNYYTCLPDDDPSFISKGKSKGGIFRRLFALFSNETHTVVEHGDPEACENQLHRVREVVGDAKLPASRTEASSSSSSSSIPAMATPFVASSMWPPGTAKYAAMTIQPSSSSSLPVVSDSGEPVGVLRRLADRTTHQSLIRCDPFAPSSTNCIGDASYLGAPYLRIMLSAFLLLPSPLPRLRVAVLGVGGGSLPSFLQRYFSREMSRLDLVDAEPQCFYAAVEDLGLRNTMRGGVMKCHVSDAVEFLENTAGSSGGTVAVVSGTRPSGTSPVLLDDTVDSVESRQRAQRYDVLFVDLFLGSEPPSFLSSMQFLRLCHGVLSSFGVAAFNLPASDPDFLKRCDRVFGRGNVFQIPVPASANVVVLARRALGGGEAVENNLHISHRHFYRRAKALQKSHALPYDLAGHYPLWWRLW